MVTREELEKRLDPYWAARPVWKGLDVHDGWLQLISDLVDRLEDDCIHPFPEIHQIKTKFGGLRFYVGYATDDQKRIIAFYESLSTSICELCGGWGKGVTIGYWYLTLCDRCEEVKSAEAKTRWDNRAYKDSSKAEWEDDGGQ